LPGREEEQGKAILLSFNSLILIPLENPENQRKLDQPYCSPSLIVHLHRYVYFWNSDLALKIGTLFAGDKCWAILVLFGLFSWTKRKMLIRH